MRSRMCRFYSGFPLRIVWLRFTSFSAAGLSCGCLSCGFYA